MTLYGALFYILAAVILAATAMAVTRRNLVHAVVYLVFSFFGTALLFYLFGAPLLAALEVIIYAGAIMVLFLFIIMMLRVESIKERLSPPGQWIPAMVIGLIYLAVGGLLLVSEPQGAGALKAAMASPGRFGAFVFERHWLAIEIVSLLLLVALIGALHLGKTFRQDPDEKGGNP